MQSFATAYEISVPAARRFVKFSGRFGMFRDRHAQNRAFGHRNQPLSSYQIEKREMPRWKT
jgi:hypothetical protein